MSNLTFHKDADLSKRYCVYMIIYEGTDMPRYYFGKGTVSNFGGKRQYHGSPGRKWEKQWHDRYSSNPEMFRRIIRLTFDTPKEATDAERWFLGEVDAKRSKSFVNSTNGRWADQTGVKRSEETRRKISEANRNRVFTPEIRARMSEAQKGKVKSPEVRERMRQSQRKMRETFVISDETREKMSKSQREKPPLTDAQREKRKISQKQRHQKSGGHSEETKARMREAQKLRWAARRERTSPERTNRGPT